VSGGGGGLTTIASARRRQGRVGHLVAIRILLVKADNDSAGAVDDLVERGVVELAGGEVGRDGERSLARAGGAWRAERWGEMGRGL